MRKLTRSNLETVVQVPKVAKGWVRQAVDRMKNGKTDGSSGIVAEMLKASDESARMVTGLSNAVMQERTALACWLNSVLVNAYQGNGVALKRENHRGLKMLEQVNAKQDRVPKKLIRERMKICEM